ncbi:uncharacterized protein LOC134247653 [Saccostrea cucullata]|uniref:uncharacterized protein LOC134247653 n=1 Tax=Saccostrea cuccullata TaxID=36930 RepID=UPI002ED3B829
MEDSTIKINLARQFYTDHWSPERQQVIADLMSIEETIQRHVKSYSIGSIGYSSIGILGGGLTIASVAAAPSTLGLSLLLNVAGIATGVSSGVAGLAHGFIKNRTIEQKCKDAKSLLNRHKETSLNMRDMLAEIITFEAETEDGKTLNLSLAKDDILQIANAALVAQRIKIVIKNSHEMYRVIRSPSDGVARFLGLGSFLDDLIPTALKDISKGVAKIPGKIVGAVAFFGIAVDAASLFSNAIDLSKMTKGELCDEAKKIDETIKALQSEYDILREIFESPF